MLFRSYRLIQNLLEHALKGRQRLYVHAPRDVQATVYETENSILLHLVNEVGKRPLSENILLSDLQADIRLGNRKVKQVRSLIENRQITCEIKEDLIQIHIDKLLVWDAIEIELEQEQE